MTWVRCKIAAILMIASGICLLLATAAHRETTSAMAKRMTEGDE